MTNASETRLVQQTPYERLISLSNLLVDVRNPRLPDDKHNQRDGIRAMIEAQSDKIVALADHLTAHGPNPANLPIVMAAEDEDQFVVLDGNRRLVALKLLESPALADGILNNRVIKRLSAL